VKSTRVTAWVSVRNGARVDTEVSGVKEDKEEEPVGKVVEKVGGSLSLDTMGIGCGANPSGRQP
jgi:hypothetical protein